MIQGAHLQSSPLVSHPVHDRGLLREKLGEVVGEVARVRESLQDTAEEGSVGRENAETLARFDLDGLHTLVADPRRSPESLRDALSTGLMELFRLCKSRACFGLLYELNSQHLLQQVASRLRRYQSKSDPGDVLQEVFFNIYRYPHRFNCEREDAFRVWTATIVRNTVLKHMRSLGRSGRAEVPFEELPEIPEREQANSPLGGVIEQESAAECHRVYLTYLHLYLRFYSMLSDREQRAIRMVEVDGLSYREAAGELGIKLENLKMVIFRARRKIHRSMRRVFDGLPPDCRPAREPKSDPHDQGVAPRDEASNTGIANAADAAAQEVRS